MEPTIYVDIMIPKIFITYIIVRSAIELNQPKHYRMVKKNGDARIISFMF